MITTQDALDIITLVQESDWNNPEGQLQEHLTKLMSRCIKDDQMARMGALVTEWNTMYKDLDVFIKNHKDEELLGKSDDDMYDLLEDLSPWNHYETGKNVGYAEAAEAVRRIVYERSQ